MGCSTSESLELLLISNPDQDQQDRHRGPPTLESRGAQEHGGCKLQPSQKNTSPTPFQNKQSTTTWEFWASTHPSTGEQPNAPGNHPPGGPGESKAGAAHPHPGGGRLREVGVPEERWKLGRPGSPTVWIFDTPSTPGQGPQPAPQGHRHPQGQMWYDPQLMVLPES